MRDDTIVPPDLPRSVPCPIAFVGEAPGDDEISHRPVPGGPIQPRPFVGPAGRVLNAGLRSAGIERADHLVTNVFNIKAPDNDVGPWLRDPEFYQPHLDRLRAEIAAANPRVIVPLGNTALWALLGAAGNISHYRGALTPGGPLAPGVKLLPTYHPSAVQRQWKLLPLFVRDLVKAAYEASRGPKIIYPKVELLVEPSYGDVKDFMAECRKSDLLSTDIETGWHQITCIGFAPTPDRAMCIPFVDLRKADRSYWSSAHQEVLVWKLIRDVLEDPKVPKLGQNFTYDVYWLLKRQGIRVMGYGEDTRLMHGTLYPELPKDLASMAASYTRFGAWKAWGGKFSDEKRDA